MGRGRPASKRAGAHDAAWRLPLAARHGRDAHTWATQHALNGATLERALARHDELELIGGHEADELALGHGDLPNPARGGAHPSVRPCQGAMLTMAREARRTHGAKQSTGGVRVRFVVH